MHPTIVVALPFFVLILAIVVGVLVALALGRPAQFWRVSLPLFLVAASVAVVLVCWPPRLAADLAGGTILVYEIRSSPDGRAGEQTPDADELVAALRRRINPAGVRDLVIRSNRQGQIEIRVGAHEGDIAELVRQRLAVAGYLEFRIMANPYRHELLCKLAEQAENFEDKSVRDLSGRVVGRWVRIGKTAGSGLEEDTIGHFSRSELFDVQTRTGNDGVVEALTKEDPFRVTGSDIGNVSAGFGGGPPGPLVNFQMTSEGAKRFGVLTGTNVPDPSTGERTRLGIVLDGELLSAPYIMSRIEDRGQITGRFTQQEVDFIVAILKAGRLPATLNPEPVSASRFAPGQRLQWTIWCVGGTMGCLLAIMLLAVFLSGRRGVVAGAAELSAVAMFAAAVLIVRVPMTFPAVSVACGGVLVLAGVFLLLSRAVKRPRVTVAETVAETVDEIDDVPSASLPPGALIVVVVLGMLFVAGAAMSRLGVGETRRIAMLLAMLSLSGAASILLCFWPLAGLLNPVSKPGDDESGVVKADLAEW